MQNLILMSPGIYVTTCIRHYINCENTVLYGNRIRCYIGIISCILTDSYRTNKREYGLHVFKESYYSDIRESYSKNIQVNFTLYSPVFSMNTEEYDTKNLYARWF